MAGQEQVLVIDEAGTIHTLYDDGLHEIGEVVNTARASHVEPGENGWDVVLSDDPRNGRFKGHVVGRGFKTRKAALDAEVDFLNEHVLG